MSVEYDKFIESQKKLSGSFLWWGMGGGCWRTGDWRSLTAPIHPYRSPECPFLHSYARAICSWVASRCLDFIHLLIYRCLIEQKFYILSAVLTITGPFWIWKALLFHGGTVPSLCDPAAGGSVTWTTTTTWSFPAFCGCSRPIPTPRTSTWAGPAWTIPSRRPSGLRATDPWVARDPALGSSPRWVLSGGHMTRGTIFLVCTCRCLWNSGLRPEGLDSASVGGWHWRWARGLGEAAPFHSQIHSSTQSRHRILNSSVLSTKKPSIMLDLLQCPLLSVPAWETSSAQQRRFVSPMTAPSATSSRRFWRSPWLTRGSSTPTWRTCRGCLPTQCSDR